MNGSTAINSCNRTKHYLKGKCEPLSSSLTTTCVEHNDHFQKPSAWIAFLSVLSHFLMLFCGYVCDFFRSLGLLHDSCPVDLPKHKVHNFFVSMNLTAVSVYLSLNDRFP